MFKRYKYVREKIYFQNLCGSMQPCKAVPPQYRILFYYYCTLCYTRFRMSSKLEAKDLPYFSDIDTSTPGIPLVRFSTRGTRVGGVHRTDRGYISRFVSLNF